MGRQFALDCAANGMKVALADIDAEAMEKTCKECEAKGVEARGYEPVSYTHLTLPTKA